MYRFLFFALTILLAPELKGQSIDTAPSGRLDQIEAERSKKQSQIQPEEPAESKITRLGRVIQRLPIGFQVDGRGPGAGAAIDAVLQRSAYGGRVLMKVWGTSWLHGFYNTGTGLELRHFSAHDLIFAVDGSHSDAPQLEYYGEGPNSSIRNLTNYRREETPFNFRVGLSTNHSLAEACRITELLLNVGPGTNSSLAATQSVFGPAQAPGINVQSNYLIVGCSGQFDLLDFPEDPHKGTRAAAAFDRYDAQTHGEFSFYRLSLLGEQYLPFFNRKRVIALRAKTDLNYHSANQVVPFYLQPTLGSDTDLRGFRRYRFYDENSLSLNAEYRWEISTGFDMAVFVDGGNVFHRPGQLSLSHLESSAGFGLRIKNQNERRVVARLDTGFSREGFQVWLRVPRLF